MTDITNAQLAAQISELVAYWRTRDLEFQGWLAGSATGGPYSDGRYPLTDYLETTYYVKSPAALQQSVTGMVNSASSYATAAAASQAAAATSKTGADTARDVAVAARDAAVAARDAASTSQSTAATLAANAQTYATSAYNSAATATSAAATATQKAADADADRIAAQAAAAAAQASATSAATFDPNLFYSKTASDSRYRQSSVAVPWADLSGVPSTFTPSAHSHVISDVTNLQATLDGKAASVHGHAISDVSGLQGALDAKAPLASPALSGTPTAPTATVGTNTTQIATTAFVRGEVSALVAAAPGTLDTLNELASALGNDPNFATTVTNSLAGKAPLTGTGASGTWNISVTGSAGSVSWTNVSGRPTALSSFTNDSGFITGITSGMVTGALGYTPYNSSNPSGYITSAALSSYLPLSGGTLTGNLTGTRFTPSGSTNGAYIHSPNDWGMRFTNNDGWIQIGPANAGWCHIYGSQTFYFNTDLYSNGYLQLHSNNYNNYAPTLTGTGASGNWGINITGSAALAVWSNVYTFSTAGAGWYRVATTGSDGRGTYNVELHCTGGSHNPSLLQICAQGDWGNDKIVYANWDGNFPANAVRITRGASNTYLEVYFTVAISSANIRINRSGFDQAVSAYYGALPAGGDTVKETLAISGKINASSMAISGNAVLNAGNYTSYALPLSGGTLSGTTNFNGTMLFPSGGGGVTFGANHYSMGKDIANGGWSHPHYSDLIIGYHTGIRIGAAYSGIRFYDNSPTTDANNDGNGDGGESLLMTIGGWAAGSGVIVNNTLSAGNVLVGGNQALHAGNFTGYLNNAYFRGAGYPSSSNDWNLLGNTYENTVQQVDPSNFSSTSNGPTAASYTYGALLNFTSRASAQAQIYISHAGNDLIFRGGWGGGSWQAWNKVLTNQNYNTYSSFSGLVTSSGNNGFANATYFNNVRNPIWSFGNAPSYGISYFQGGSGRDGTDTIALHPNGATTATGAAFAVNGYNAFAFNNVVLHAGNYNSYAPSLTGTGASGTWGINITGNAATVGSRSPGGSAGNLAVYDSSNGYLYAPTWIGINNGGGIFSTSGTNGAHWSPTGATFGVWGMSGSKNGYSGISCLGASHYLNWMVDMGGNLQGWYNQSYGWQMFWSGGSLYCFKNSYGGGTQAVVLDSANYSSYALPLSAGISNMLSGEIVRSANGGVDGAYLTVLKYGTTSDLQSGTSTANRWIGIDATITAGAAVSNVLRIRAYSGGTGNAAPVNVADFRGDQTSYFYNSITSAGNVTAYSDERVKANWRNLDDGFVSKFASVKSGIYDRIDIDLTQAGVSAQSLREVLPHAVIESADGELSVAYGNAALVASIELAKEVVALRHEVEQLKQQLH